MKNKYFYPIFKLKAKSWIRYWLLKKTEFKGKLSEILTGFSFNLENTLNRKFKIFEILGNSVQDGEPSPENEVPILNAGDNGSITEKIVNENYLSLSEATVGTAGVTASISETKMKFSGKMAFATNIFNAIKEDKTIPAGTYKLSYKKLSGTTSGSGDWAVYFRFFNANGTRLLETHFASNESRTVKNLVLSEDVAYYAYYAFCNSTSLIFNDLELGFMITKDTPTDYIPHKEQTYTIQVLRPMLSLGDVRDCFVKVNGNWFERHYINRKVFDGSKDEVWIYEKLSYGNNFYINISNAKGGDEIPVLSNCFKYYEHGNLTSNYSCRISEAKNLNLRHQDFTNVYDFKNWLAEKYASGNPVYVDYLLATPLELPCTEEQIEILENLPKTDAGQTNIYSPDEVKPFLKIQYWESDTNG